MPTTLYFDSQSLNLGAHKINADPAVVANSARFLDAITTSRTHAMQTYSHLDKYQHAAAGRFLAAGGERFSLCDGWRVPRGSVAPFRRAGDFHRRKSGGRGARGVSTGGIFSDPRSGMPAGQGCRTGGRGRGAADKAARAGGDKDSPIAETEASGTDFAGAGADNGKTSGVGTGLSRGVGQREALRV